MPNWDLDFTRRKIIAIGAVGATGASAGCTSDQDNAAEESPTDDSPTEEPPTEDSPTEESPTEDSPTEDSGDSVIQFFDSVFSDTRWTTDVYPERKS